MPRPPIGPLLALAALACRASDPEPPGPPAAAPAEPALVAAVVEDEDEPVHDGAWLYERNCSGCHGAEGHGDGETARQLGVQARDFAAGGFSFGNTKEDMMRTVRSGIPGRSVMPAFAGILKEDEIALVVEHVRTLMPAEVEEDRSASVMRVGARAAVARGKLPPLEEGEAQIVRGLLVGLPSGLTFEYDLDPVRLVAVRLGPFADREDWRNRGGGYLRPLGVLVHELRAHADETAVELRGEEVVPLRAELRSTWTEGERAGLDYALLDPDRLEVALVHESLRAVPLSAGGAFARRLVVDGLGRSTRVVLWLAGDRGSDFPPVPGSPTEDSLGVWEEPLGPWSVGRRARSAPDEPEPPVECLYFRRVGTARGIRGREGLRVLFDLPRGSSDSAEAIVTLLPDASAERLAALEAEIEALARKEASR